MQDKLSLQEDKVSMDRASDVLRSLFVGQEDNAEAELHSLALRAADSDGSINALYLPLILTRLPVGVNAVMIPIGFVTASPPLPSPVNNFSSTGSTNYCAVGKTSALTSRAHTKTRLLTGGERCLHSTLCCSSIPSHR